MASADASSNEPPDVRRPETTGSFWLDLKEAFRGFREGKRLSPLDDLRRLDQIPCVRNSLMSGIASGVGLGVVRAFSTSIMSGFHWSMGTFIFISVATWTMCQRNLRQERTLMLHIIEQQTAKRRLKRPADSADWSHKVPAENSSKDSNSKT